MCTVEQGEAFEDLFAIMPWDAYLILRLLVQPAGVVRDGIYDGARRRRKQVTIWVFMTLGLKATSGAMDAR